MINIVFAVPYPEMRQAVHEVFESHPKRPQLSRNIKVVQAEKLNIDDLRGCIIVARGLTYSRIRSQFPNLPCVEVVVHTADIIAALLNCKTNYAPKCIGLVGHFPHLPPAETLSAMVGTTVRYYPQDSVRTMRIQVQNALADGVDAFAGGYSLCLWAEANGRPAALVTSSREAIRAALDEAVRTYDILRESEISRIALENAKEAVVFADTSLLVGYRNPAARRLLSRLGLAADGDGVPLAQALPFLARRLDGVESRAEPTLSLEDELFDWRGTTLTVTANPARIGPVAAGTVFTVTTVESIRRQEYSIRERLSEKGLRARYTFDDIVYGTDRMASLVAKAKKCALVSSNVLLVGETGTGKELFAQSIHNHSSRKDGPFVAINCAALPEHLIESELFGYSEGAFTGARKGGRMGLIETAHGGTLFLDEISELPLPVQGKLLRVLQEREVRRVGDDRMAAVDVRVISASNRFLPEAAAQGRFRRDLLYRLDILSLHIPPLRERRADIAVLFRHMLERYNTLLGGHIDRLDPRAEALLLRHGFEGNVRELRNIVERLCVLGNGGMVSEAEMRECLDYWTYGHGDGPGLAPPSGSVGRGEADDIRAALERAGWNRTQAARTLGMDRSTLWRKMRRFAIEPPR